MVVNSSVIPSLFFLSVISDEKFIDVFSNSKHEFGMIEFYKSIHEIAVHELNFLFNDSGIKWEQEVSELQVIKIKYFVELYNYTLSIRERKNLDIPLLIKHNT